MRHLRCLLALGVLLVGVAGARAEKVWKVQRGATTMFFSESILRATGLRVVNVNETAPDLGMAETGINFAISGESTLRLNTQDGRFLRFNGGYVKHNGGYAVVHDPTGFTIPMDGFKVQPNGTGLVQTGVMFSGNNGNSPFKFALVDGIVFVNTLQSEFDLMWFDITISKDFALRIRRPDLIGTWIGMGSVCAHVELESQTGVDNEEPRDPLPSGVIDLGLISMGSLQSAGRTGTYPNGRNGLTMSTTSCNRGSTDVVWNAPMAVNHPVIAMALFRVRNGRFEQVGYSWLKHGFLATNSTDPGCGTCQNPGTGQLLGPGCTDTYGTGNNSDRRYLGDRKEVNPFTGVWTCVGSWFSNYVADCTRRNTGSGLPDEVVHRLEVDDSDLTIGDPNYYYEAWYINQGETNHYNQVGYRKATPNWNGSMWTFATTTAMVQAPAIMSYGDMRSIAEPRSEGDVILAVKTTDLGGGQYHYEYAMYAFNFDRQVRQFTIPIQSGVNVTNIGFRDVDKVAGNDWTPTLTANQLTWQTETYAQNPNANSLKYGLVYNFWFDANTAPNNNTTTTLGLFKPGSLTELTAVVNGPGPAPVTVSGQVVLQGWVGPTTPPAINLEFRPVGGGQSTFYNGLQRDANGNFSISVPLRGTFDVYARAGRFLTKKIAGLVIGDNNISGVDFQLKGGDVDSNNEVWISDYAIMSYAYNTVPGDFAWYPPADVNGDESIDIGDFALISINYGDVGD